MNENFVSYELALKLKELGFNEECLGYYTGDTNHFVWRPSMLRQNREENDAVTAPLYQQVTKWLREVHNIALILDFSGRGQGVYDYWHCKIYQGTLMAHVNKTHNYSYEKNPGTMTDKFENLTYGQALELGLQEALKLIKQ